MWYLFHMKLNPAEFVIHRFGGVRATAKIVNREPSSVSRWQRLGWIPHDMMILILTETKDTNIDICLQDLVYGRDVPMAEIKR